MAETPRVSVAFEAIRRRGDGWLVTWRVRNGASFPFTIVEAWHPHKALRSSRLERHLVVPARGTASLELPARIDGLPGDVVENVFVIFRGRGGRATWRILARSTLRIDDTGLPHVIVERVDVQQGEA